jgi:hypothetical protein
MVMFDWVWMLNSALVGLPMLAAWRWGAAPERICAAVFVANLVVDRLYHLVAGRGTIYLYVDIGHLAIGIATAVVLVRVALTANRIYPLWLSAFQGLVIISHFTREASAKVSVPAYALLTYGPSIFQIVILSFGIALHARRLNRYGRYPSWRNSSSRSPDETHTRLRSD